jgi:predicted PurR-regulated permease PerM
VHESHNIFTNFIVGKLLDSLVVTIICFIGCLILGVPYAGLFSAIIGVFNIIPVFGPVVGTAVSTFILLVIDPLKALWFLIFVVVLLQIDGNIIEPKIHGDSTGLSACWVMIAIIIGGGCFGFVGMFLSVPTFAVLYWLVGKVINKRLEKKNLPLELESYASEEHKII